MNDVPEAGPAPGRHVIAVDPARLGMRLDRLLAFAIPGLSRSRAKSLIEAGRVARAGVTLSEPSWLVKPGPALEVEVPVPVAARPEPQAIPLRVLYEDEHVVVVDKPAGLVVHPAPGNPDRTLVNALLAHCGASLAGIGGVRRPGIVHRLDKNTSGVMVAAKTQAAHARLVVDFSRHAIDRAYLAVVWGVPSQRSGAIDLPIGRSARDRKKMAVRRRDGKPALTRYRVARCFGAAASVLECTLETGRTHQIRVHLASIGHPVIGDATYGGATPARLKALGDGAALVKAFPRQALHAFRLGFQHPARPEKVLCTANPPKDINDLLTILEKI